jgi:hypothetical protein
MAIIKDQDLVILKGSSYRELMARKVIGKDKELSVDIDKAGNATVRFSRKVKIWTVINGGLYEVEFAGGVVA